MKFFSGLILGFILVTQAWATYIPNAVTSSGTKDRLERVTFSNGSSPSISQQSGPFSVSYRGSTGQFTLSITSGTFSAAPSCTCSAHYNSANVVCNMRSDLTYSSTSVSLDIGNNGGSLSGGSVSVICAGPR